MVRPLRGFSLVELVLVVAILAVVTAVAMPRYQAALARYRLEAGTRRLAADLQLAQESARTAGARRTVIFDLLTSQLRIPELSDPLRGSSGSYLTRLGEFPYYCRIVSADLGGDQEVIFDGFGQPDSGGQIILSCGSLTRTIELQARSGQVRLGQIMLR